MDEPHTQIPNWAIKMMPKMSGPAWKVYTALCREILGWQKTTDRVTLGRLHALTGAAVHTIRSGLNQLIALGMIGWERSGRTYKWTIYIEDNRQAQPAATAAFPGETIGCHGRIHSAPTADSNRQPLPTPKKERKVKKTSPSEKAVPANVDPLYDRLLNAFLRKNDEADWDFGREGQHIHKLLKKANARPDPAAFLSQLLETFYELTEKSPEKFWRSRPFLPSALNASGIYPQVVKLMRHQENGRMTPEQAQRIRATSFS